MEIFRGLALHRKNNDLQEVRSRVDKQADHLNTETEGVHDEPGDGELEVGPGVVLVVLGEVVDGNEGKLVKRTVEYHDPQHLCKVSLGYA